jgi:hypothetical protein
MCRNLESTSDADYLYTCFSVNYMSESWLKSVLSYLKLDGET